MYCCFHIESNVKQYLSLLKYVVRNAYLRYISTYYHANVENFIYKCHKLDRREGIWF